MTERSVDDLPGIELTEAAAGEAIRTYGPPGAPLKDTYQRALMATAGGRGTAEAAARVRAAGRVLGLTS